jgi:hypothetical protein
MPGLRRWKPARLCKRVATARQETQHRLSTLTPVLGQNDTFQPNALTSSPVVKLPLPAGGASAVAGRRRVLGTRLRELFRIRTRWLRNFTACCGGQIAIADMALAAKNMYLLL